MDSKTVDDKDLLNVEINEAFSFKSASETSKEKRIRKSRSHPTLGNRVKRRPRIIKESTFQISDDFAQENLVSIHSAIAAFILVLYTSFPTGKNFKLDIWVTSKVSDTPRGGKVVIPVDADTLLMQLLTDIDDALLEIKLSEVHLEGSSLHIQWLETSSNHVEAYPLALPKPTDKFIRFEFFHFTKGCKWEDVTISFKKGTIFDHPPESPLPNYIGHVTQVFRSLAIDSKDIFKAKVQDLKVLPPDESDRLLCRFSNLENFEPKPVFDGPNGPEQPYLSSIFEAAVRAHPTRPALVCGPSVWTYEELYEDAKSIAALLIKKYNVGRNDTVMLMLPRNKAGSLACILGVIMAGAAYVPVDWQKAPLDRCSYIIEDCKCKVAIVCDFDFKGKLIAAVNDCVVITSDDLEHELDKLEYVFEECDVQREPEDMAYIIYTSGTTGKPKGVVVMQYNVAYLVLCEREVYGVKHTDRSYQNASHSFDFSVEEIWVCWAAGAALVAPTPEMLTSGPDLPELLEEAGITIFSCVPTHLSILARDIEGVRIIIMGGEAAQESALNRFRRPGRKIFNTYGPTETTITATYLDISEPVANMTIGKALPGFTSYIIEPETKRLLPHGGMGELVIGGECVTQGYLNREDLTTKSFYPNNFQHGMPHWEDPSAYPRNDRLYRSGDLCRFTFDGRIEYFGRIDCQVKLRGFRIELGEIESVLMECDNVQTAICHVWTDTIDDVSVQTLCAYLVLEDAKKSFSEPEVRDRIGQKLATYMIPSAFVILEANELPRLPSGKVDRKNLMKPDDLLDTSNEETDYENTTSFESDSDDDITSSIHGVWKKVFQSADVGLDDHFFKDLNGHSLLAARLISIMRQNPDLAGVGVKDLYHSPTINDLAAFVISKNPDLQKSESTKGGVGEDRSVDDGKPKSRKLQEMEEFFALPYHHAGISYWICSFFQLLAIYPLVFIGVIPLLVSVLGAFQYNKLLEKMIGGTYWEVSFLVLMFCGFIAGRLIQLLVIIIIKKLVIWKFEEGTFKIYSFYYFRWWFVQNMLGSISFADFEGTPFINVFFRFLGAKIGKNVQLMTSGIGCLDLLEIGDGATVGSSTLIPCYEVRNGYIRCGKVTIGENAIVASHCTISIHTTISDDATLDELSTVRAGTVIPEAETWKGSSATRITDSRADLAPIISPSRIRKFMFGLGLFFAWCVLAAYGSILLMPMFAGSYLLIANDVFGLNLIWPFIIAFPASTIGAILFCLSVVLLKWVVVGRFTAGTYPIHGLQYIRNWMFSSIFTTAVVGLRNLFSTIYMPPWLRMLGSKIGKNSECSFFAPMNCELMELGDGVFVADGVCTGAPRYGRGQFTTGYVKVGDKSFLGNQSVVPINTTVEPDALLGVDSAPPFIDGQYIIKSGETWLGNPAICIPQREVYEETFDDKATFKPPKATVIGRLVWEYFRIVVPLVVNGLVFYAEFLLLVLPEDLDIQFGPLIVFDNVNSWWIKMVLLPVVVMCSWVVISFLVIGMKWFFIGEYKPVKAPLYSSFVRRTELCCGIQEQLCENFLSVWRGTPLVGIFFRIFGSKIGKRVYFDSYDITEHDLVVIEDHATLGPFTTLQTHLFEDRVMKLGPIHIGSYSNIGARCTILYDTKIGSKVEVRSLSLVMKGEDIPSGIWAGLPVSYARK